MQNNPQLTILKEGWESNLSIGSSGHHPQDTWLRERASLVAEDFLWNLQTHSLSWGVRWA